MSHNMLVALFALLMIPGVLGVVLPVLPGIPLMFAVALIFGIVDGFAHLVWWELGILFLLTVLSVAVDYAAGLLGARYGGAGRWAAVAGFVGMVVGLIAFPPFGGLIGLFVGVLVVELFTHRENLRAIRAATGGLLGAIIGIAISLVLAVAFLVLFIIFALG